MTRPALLNNIEHKDLRVNVGRGSRFGDDVMFAFTFPGEFRSVQAHYPIVFGRSPDGTLSPLALFGFREKQNLFLNEDGWDAPYLPLILERGPFLIGRATNGKVIHIDLDSPRINREEGERIFLEHGANSEYLEHISRVLGTLDEGVEATAPFVAALIEHDLLEPFTLDIQFQDGAQHRFTGFHTINEDKLNKLDIATLGKLHERGYLSPIYMVVASLAHFRTLSERANRQNAAQR